MNQAVDWEDFYRTGRHRTAWELSGRAPELVAFLAANPPSAESAALDLGCGTGGDLILLAEAGYQAVGIDLSPTAVALAQKRCLGSGARALVGDVLSLPLPDSAFDLVTDRGCFHHLGPGDRERYAAEIARVLKPSGLVFIRGCREKRLPFVPITRSELEHYFSTQWFLIRSVVPFLMQTDTGAIPGCQGTLRRRP